MTSYNDYLSLLKASCQSACDYIPKLCHALREENPQFSNRDIRVRVRKDCIAAGLASSTITRNIPQKFKNPNKVKAGKMGAKEKKKKNETQAPKSASHAQENTGIVDDKKDVGSSLESHRIDDNTEKKKILLQITTSGASESAAENSPESEKQPDLRILENPWIKEVNTGDGKKWKSKDEVQFLKKQLSKQIEENREKDIQIEKLKNEIIQLSEAIKQISFTPAKNYKPLSKEFDFPEPDESNRFVWKNITFDEFRMELGPLKARADTKINVYLERVVV